MTCDCAPRFNTVAAVLYVTDADPRDVPATGDTMAERRATREANLKTARNDRLVAVSQEFARRVNADAPPFVNEQAATHVRRVIQSLVVEGLLAASHEGYMLDNVRLAVDGNITARILERGAYRLEVTP